MPWYAFYRTEDGRLVSLADELPQPLAPGLAYVECGDECPVAADWNEQQRAFVAPAAPKEGKK